MFYQVHVNHASRDVFSCSELPNLRPELATVSEKRFYARFLFSRLPRMSMPKRRILEGSLLPIR